MRTQRPRNVFLTAVFLVGVASCGGGSSQLAGGGIGGTGVSQGPITGFGSIFVNGVEFNTTGATIIKDGSKVTQNDLKIGMVVNVDGNIASPTSGTASTVTYVKELEGPITAKTANTLTVLGQTVIVDDLTQIEKPGFITPTISDLSQNDNIEVSGALSANGIRATYIEVKSNTNNVELKGIITAKTNSTLTIGGQLIDLSAITPSFIPAIGNYVEVKGSLVGTTLVATSLELKSQLGTGNKEKAELQGFVTSVGSSTDFALNAQPVKTNTQTKFKGGITTDIKIGVKLEVQGSLVNGVLIATEVNFENDLELEGDIQTVNAANGSGSLVLVPFPGIEITFDSVLTETEGGANLNTLIAGNHIKVHGRKLDGNDCNSTYCVLATQLELESSNPGAGLNVLLQGPVDSSADPLITILGVTVDTTILKTFDGDGVTNKSSFFTKAKIGSLVEVHGSRDGQGNVIWESIKLDD